MLFDNKVTFTGFYTKITLITTVAVLSMWHVWLDIFTIAVRDDEAKHIFLVPLVFGWLVWVRRQHFQLASGNGWMGLTLVLVGVGLHELGLALSLSILFHLSAVIVLYGGFALCLNLSTLRKLLPAFASLLFLIPVPGLIRQQVSMPLQYYSASLANASLSVMGIQAEQAGHILSLDGTAVLIAEACNGMRMIMAVLLSLFAFCFSIDMNRWLRALVLVAVPVAALLLNWGRLVVTVWFYAVTSESIAGLFHDLSGWILPVLILASASMIPTTRPVSRPAKHRQEMPHTSGQVIIPQLLTICTLLIVLAANMATYPNQQTVLAHRQRLKDQIANIPYAVGDWVAIDKPLHREESKLLKPLIAIRRTYRNLKDGKEIHLFAVACERARDLVGHEPGTCYVGQGWTRVSQIPLNLRIENQTLRTHAFEFMPPSKSDVGGQSTRVLSLIVTPRGHTTGDTSDLAEAACDYRLEKFGAAALQLSTTDPIPREQWHQATELMVATFLPVVEQFRHRNIEPSLHTEAEVSTEQEIEAGRVFTSYGDAP